MRGNRFKRKMDHLLGTPCLIALGWIRSRNDIPKNISNVAIFSCSAIGDTIIASAIAREIKAKLPHCKVFALTSPLARGISALVEGYDDDVALNITQFWRSLRAMREHRVDVLIDVTPWPRMTALLTALSGAKFTIGFRTPYQHRHYAYDSVVAHRADRHEVENLHALLQPLGITGRMRPRASKRLCAMVSQPKDDLRTIVIHPWASGFRSSMREWALENWVELSRRLITDNARLLITGGSSDRSRAESLAAMIDRPDRVIVLAGSANLAETAEQMAAADVVISVNTGTMHLAAAFDLNLVALHGPTDPRRWGPLSPAAVIIGPGPDNGGAYLNLGFEYPAHATDCMSLIDVDEVMRAVTALRAVLPDAAGAHRPGLPPVPVPGVREAVQRAQRRPAEPRPPPLRCHRAGGAVAAALPPNPAGP